MRYHISRRAGPFSNGDRLSRFPPEPAPAEKVEREPDVRTDAWRDGDLRISGLQLPDDAVTGGGQTAARSFAVNQTTSYRWTLAEDLAGFAKAGIAGIGLYRPKLQELDEEVAIDLIRDSGLTVSSLSWVGGFTGSDGSKLDEALFDAAEAVRFAAAVGAGTVGVITGGRGPHIAKHARRVLVDALVRLCDAAGEIDVRLSLHPMSASAPGGQSILTTLDETLGLIDSADQPNLGMVFDIAQLSREPNVVGRIGQFASCVHVVRLSDRRPRNDRRRPGDGPLPVASAVQSFIDAGYVGPFEFDLWTDSSAGSDDYEALLAACRARFESFGVTEDPRV